MPKRRRPRRIPTPAWERPKGRLQRELGGKVYLVAGLVGLVALSGLIIVFAFVKDYLDERALPGSTAIAVDDRSFDLDYFAARLRLIPSQVGSSSAVQFVDVVADQIIEEETVRRFAGELGISFTPDEVNAELATRLSIEKDDPNFASTYQAELDRTGFLDQEYRQMVEAQLLAGKVSEKLGADIPADAEQVRYSQIQVATDGDAQTVLDRLQGGEDFAALARELSTDVQTREQGGDRGWLPKGAADPSLEDTLFLLEPGGVSDPFPTSNGVYLFQVLEKAVRPLDDSQRQQVQGQAYQRWLEEKQQGLEINNYVGTDSEKLDEEKLRWVLERAPTATAPPITPLPLTPSP